MLAGFWCRQVSMSHLARIVRITNQEMNEWVIWQSASGAS